MITFCATYSPEDNKLRLTASARLDADLYARVKAAGFIWAPKQELFVAPKWTPGREDLCLELAGEIGDEDTSLVDRAEARAERFDGYRANRLADSAAAQRAVKAITDNIPLGQPILIGRHSERHARRDQKRIESGMRRSIHMWETAEYWDQRAAGALRHASYKEKPAVRARRIRTLEAALRKCERDKSQSQARQQAWTGGPMTIEQARRLANVSHFYVAEKDGHRWSAWDVLRPDEERYSACPAMTVEEVQAAVAKIYGKYLPKLDRWIHHYTLRIGYERTMLAAQGASALLDKKPRRVIPPLLNYRAPGGTITVPNPYRSGDTQDYPQVDMTREAYAMLPADRRGTRIGPNKQHRFRTALLAGHQRVCVFLTGTTAHDAPPASPDTDAAAPADAPEAAEVSSTEEPSIDEPPPPAPLAAATDLSAAAIDAMKQSLRSGIRVHAVPSLFATSPQLAAKMVGLADIRDEHRVLEPSAGTGALMKAIRDHGAKPNGFAVEIDSRLSDQLAILFPEWNVFNSDFLGSTSAGLGQFDLILMNPPFDSGSDIAHIKHAFGLLAPGGRLVTICANGPRQREQLQPLAMSNQGSWEDLPAGSFKHAGTMVNTALVVINAPA